MEIPPPVRHLTRPTFKPVVEPGEQAGLESRFGGQPWLPAGEGWPRCGDCGNPMTFFLQVAAAEVPAAMRERFGAGLLQMFYCTDGCDGFEAFSPASLIRLVRPFGTGATPAEAATENFAAKRIVSWTEQVDLPDWDELADLGVELPEEEIDALGQTYPRAGDKLGGWPHWVQGVEYPSCRRCGRRMELLVQVDSEDNVPWMFGDMGCGHITQCPDHLDELAFGWACC